MLAGTFVYQFAYILIIASLSLEVVLGKEPPGRGRNHLEGKEGNISTYRSLSLVSLSSIDRIVVLSDMQVQKMLIREIFLAFATPVHVRLLVVHFVFFNGHEGERLVWGQ
jgi:hypothetical protein